MHTIHEATFRSYIRDVSLTLSLLRDDGRFLIRFHRVGGVRVCIHVCRSAGEAETLYCRLLHFAQTGEDLWPIAPDPGAYLGR
jgi:hypothetical protein